MKDVKKVALITVLVAISLLGITLAIVKTFRLGGGKPPDRVTGVVVKKIDEKSLEVFNLTEAEWMDLGQKDQRYKNPQTGEYTVVTALVCAGCGKDMPSLIYPRGADAAVRQQFDDNWVCPHCGRKVSGGAPDRGRPRR